MSFSHQQILSNALSANEKGNFHKAIKMLEPILQSDEIITQAEIWTPTWATVSKIFKQLDHQRLADLSERNLFNQESSDLLYLFGYELVEEGLYTLGVPVLKRAALLFPNEERVLTELAHIYEQLKLYGEGKKCLLQSPDLVETSFMPRYLVAFYSLMTGDLQEAMDWFAGLPQLLMRIPIESRDSYAYMCGNISHMITRGKLLEPHTPLDSYDLLGWNGVINGNIVLHRSEYGMEFMGGRYAFYQESCPQLFSCIHSLKCLLSDLSISPQRILSLPDCDSRILSHLAAKFFQCPVEILSEATCSLPGLVTCYSSDFIDSEGFDLLSEACEGQVFWCHASNWTQGSIAPDFISYFAQCASPPWGKRIDLDEKITDHSDEKPPTISKEPLEGSAEHISDTLYQTYEAEPIEDTTQTKKLARILFSDGNVFHTKRTRSNQWADSPVSSQSFSFS